MTTCEICRGSRKIVMPRYRELEVYELKVAPALSAFKEFACPECSPDLVRAERFFVVDAAYEVPAEMPDQLRQHLLERAGHRLVDGLIRGGFIEVTTDQVDHRGRIRISSRLRAVHPKNWQPFEERIAERQFEVALAVVKQTEEEIANWCSYYHGREGGSVGKWQALAWIREAFSTIKGKYDAARGK